MKVLFSIEGKSARLADKERMIFDFGNHVFCDIHGNTVSSEESFYSVYDDEDLDDPWSQCWIEYECLKEPLISESTVEPACEIDDEFGNYGFKNKAGEFVIEPQYAYAYEFTCGLAAVNLNRTWYKNEEGRRVYENHFGYIDENGKTVIPFAYDEAYPFNKYGVAVVETLEDNFLINTKGEIIPETENLSFEHYYGYEDRFFEFTYKSEQKDLDSDDELVGIYDTKDRKVLLEPSIDSIIEWSEDLIKVYEYDGECSYSDFGQYYVNSKGEILYPWLYDKGFEKVEIPNKSLVTVVAISKYIELPIEPSDDFRMNDKKYKRCFLYGIYSPKGHFIVPMQYEQIIEVAENIFACLKEGVFTIIKLDESDY